MSDPDETGRYPWVGEFLLEDSYLTENETHNLGALVEGGAFGGDPEQAKAAHADLITWHRQPGPPW